MKQTTTNHVIIRLLLLLLLLFLLLLSGRGGFSSSGGSDGECLGVGKILLDLVNNNIDQHWLQDQKLQAEKRSESIRVTMTLVNASGRLALRIFSVFDITWTAGKGKERKSEMKHTFSDPSNV